MSERQKKYSCPASADAEQRGGAVSENAEPHDKNHAENASSLPGSAAPPSLARRYSFKLISNIFGIPLFLVMEAVLPRALGPAGYGAFSYATGIFQYLTNFLDFGTSTCLFTTLAKRQNEWPLLAFFLRVSLLILVLCLLFAGLCMLPPLAARFMPGVPAWVIPFAALWAFATWGVRVLRGVNDALGQTVQSEKARTIAGVAACIALLALHFVGVLSLPVLFVHQLAYLGGMILAFKIIVLEGFQDKWAETGDGGGQKRKMLPSLSLEREQSRAYVREFAAYSLPLFIQLVVVTLTLMADRWLLQVFDGNVEQGYFSISQKVGMACFLFVAAMTPLLTRELAVAHGRNDFAEMGRLFSKFAPMLYAVAAYFSAFACLEAAAMVDFFGGEEFAAALLTVQIMALYPIHQGYGQLTQAVYYASAQTRALSKITVISSLSGLLASLLLLIPKEYGGLAMGAEGLALKMVGIQFLVANFMLFMCSRFIPLPLGRLLLHQFVCLGLFLFLAWAAGLAGELLPGTLGSQPFGLKGLPGKIVGFCLRGLLYSMGVGIVCMLCPWLAGTSHQELLGLWRRFKGRR
ncbi:MAG: lipopolysaccharide biosynthesis protein [Desulfovibrionaceae bacterium]|nr:lipopolysaccharide biosynthesis protein [Desulfovibrionaceae bacterium]